LPILSFDHADLQVHIAKLSLHTVYQRYPHPFHEGDSIEVEPCPTNRDRFIVNARVLLVLFMRDMRLHLPNSNQFQPLSAR
jgi:hypothetical protein